MDNKLVDIHNHMLFNIDDGSESLENSIEMAWLSVESGVSDVICTPHSIPGMYDNYAGDELNYRFNQLKMALEDEKIPLNIHLGMEVIGNENIVDDLKKKRLCTLANSKYMLIEFRFDETLSFVNYILEHIADYGYMPIIAHPERYKFVAKAPSILYEWADKNYLMQCNKDSIRGKFGKMVQNICMDMLQDSLYSFVASDAHGATHRTPFLQYEFNIISDLFSEEYAKMLFCVNPQKILL